MVTSTSRQCRRRRLGRRRRPGHHGHRKRRCHAAARSRLKSENTSSSPTFANIDAVRRCTLQTSPNLRSRSKLVSRRDRTFSLDIGVQLSGLLLGPRGSAAVVHSAGAPLTQTDGTRGMPRGGINNGCFPRSRHCSRPYAGVLGPPDQPFDHAGEGGQEGLATPRDPLTTVCGDKSASRSRSRPFSPGWWR